MAVLKNKTQKNFTMISNNILRDNKLRMTDRGTLCTICSLPDGWNFSVAGLSAIVPDGKSALSSSLKRLEKIGYLRRKTIHGKQGKFETEIEVIIEKEDESEKPSSIIHVGETVTDKPTRLVGSGRTITDNQSQYNTDNKKQNINNDAITSINLSDDEAIDGETDAYREMIADNIKLGWLLDAANKKGEGEIRMVNEVYDVICDMVCFPRKEVVINKTKYPWAVVRSQFLKLRYEHIAAILNRIVDSDLEIRNMSAYLISSLYNQSLVGTIEKEASISDDYLKSLRGQPY